MNDSNYSNDPSSEENLGFTDKYSVTGESKFSVDGTLPRDNEIISERHYQLNGIHPNHRDRHPDSAPLEGAGSAASKADLTPEFRPSDTSIHEAVCEALLSSYDINSSEIEVFVRDGEVTLKGFVETNELKMKVIEIASAVGGVSAIHNQMGVIFDTQPERELDHGLIQNRTGLN